ncbi:MAG: hypothetical protein AAF563_11700 [Pseudomonadota bacterium]
MLDLDNHVIFADGPDDDTVLAMPRDIAEIVFHEAFGKTADPKLTYADFTARRRTLEDLQGAPAGDDLLALMMAETKVITKSTLKTLSAL